MGNKVGLNLDGSKKVDIGELPSIFSGSQELSTRAEAGKLEWLKDRNGNVLSGEPAIVALDNVFIKAGALFDFMKPASPNKQGGLGIAKESNMNLEIRNSNEAKDIYETVARLEREIMENTGIKDNRSFDFIEVLDEIKGEKKISFDDIFIKSSNIGSIKLLESIGFKEQIDFFERMGLTSDVKISGLNIVSNNLPNYWNETASKFISFGYGISISPISLATSFSTLVNGGVKVQPTIFLGQNNLTERIIKYQTSKKINILLQKIQK